MKYIYSICLILVGATSSLASGNFANPKLGDFITHRANGCTRTVLVTNIDVLNDIFTSTGEISDCAGASRLIPQTRSISEFRTTFTNKFNDCATLATNFRTVSTAAGDIMACCSKQTLTNSIVETCISNQLPLNGLVSQIIFSNTGDVESNVVLTEY